jgi:uncharacterized repeat protein (TIGR03847 family)
MSASFDLPSPVRVTVGAVGPPGKRVFYLQARQADELVSLKLEKEQVLFLAGGLSEVLADLASPAAVPNEAELELEEPVLPAWSVGSMQLAYDPGNDRVVLVAREIGGPEEDEDDEDDEEVVGEVPGAPEAEAGELAGAGIARVVLTREQAAGVIEHGKRLLRGGRPACPSCGFPLDDQHSCPKMNGHHAPSL